jgi:hypothetical protein
MNTSNPTNHKLKTARVLLLGFSLVFLTGCAAFETTPADVHQKLTHPLDGHLYVPLETPQTIARY